MLPVIVLGSGVVGLTAAYALAQKGFAVSVIDSGPEAATTGASYGNGAQLSYFYTDAMASPSLARNLPKYVMGHDPAFNVRLSLSPSFLLWGLRFLANSTQTAFERNTIDILKLALEARRGIAELSGKIKFDHSETGKITLYPTAESLEKARHLSDLKNQYGACQVILTRDQAIEKDPGLAHYGHHLAGAVWSPHDEGGDSHLFCIGLRKLLERQYGVEFHLNTTVNAIRTRRDILEAIDTDKGAIECSRAVLSLGAWSPALARTVGIRLPIWPVQGYSFTVPALQDAPLASITDTSRKTVFCRIGDRLRVAGLADIGPMGATFNAVRFKTLLEAAKGIFPKAGDYEGEVEGWTGMRPVTPDSKPIVGNSKVRGLYLNCGHGSLGWTLSMGTAEQLANLMYSQRGSS